MRLLDGITDNAHEFEQTLGDSEGWGARCAVVCGVAKSRTGLSD